MHGPYAKTARGSAALWERRLRSRAADKAPNSQPS
jgi:hypothetical protein